MVLEPIDFQYLYLICSEWFEAHPIVFWVLMFLGLVVIVGPFFIGDNGENHDP